MNFTPVEEAYNVQHIQKGIYGGIIRYSSTCIYCSHTKSTSLMNGMDGGAFRRCDCCRKNFKANLLTKPITNYSYSTHHLKGTN